MNYYLTPFTIALAAGCGWLAGIILYIYAWAHV